MRASAPARRRQPSHAGAAKCGWRALLPLVWLCALPQAVGAEVTANARYGAVARADFGNSRLNGREVGFGLRWNDARSGTLRIGLDYAYTRYEYDRLPTRNRDLHRMRVPVEWKAGSGLRHAVMLAPVIAASSNVFKDLVSRGSNEDFSVHGRWQLEQPADGAALGWRVGVARNDAFGSLRFQPLVAMLWSGASATAELGWPESRVEWRVRPALSIGAELLPAGGRWHVVSDERDGADFYYNLEAWQAAFTAAWSPRRRLQLAARAGAEFARQHRFEDDTGAIVDREADAAPFFELAVGWRW